MKLNLERYLNDHLAGSSAAVDLLETLANHSPEDGTDRDFFHDLKARVEEDRLLLKDLIHRLGHDDSRVLQVAGSLTAKASRMKLMWEGLDPGELGRFEALEVLTLGIQGKRLLWRMLQSFAPQVPQWAGIDFAALEQEAVFQRDAVEGLRIEAGISSLHESAD